MRQILRRLDNFSCVDISAELERLMQKIQKILNVTLLATETSHVFCCVLPTIFSLLSLLAGIGLIGAIPPGVESLHDLIHNWELPIIMVSGLVLVLGWWVYDYAKKMDCDHMGDGHEVCASKKKRSATVLKVASMLFVINVGIFFFVHRPMTADSHDVHTEHAQHEHAHEGHDH
jgi:hypothetical protein